MCWAVGEAARWAAFCSLAPELLTCVQLPIERRKSARPWKKSFLSMLSTHASKHLLLFSSPNYTISF